MYELMKKIQANAIESIDEMEDSKNMLMTEKMGKNLL